MNIYLNGQLLGIQPSQLEEDPIPIQTDVQAIDGSTQRNFQATKYQAKMSFTNLSISGYQQIMGLIASGVTYLNNLSAETSNGTLTFSGNATYQKYPYVSGASLYQQLDVVIRQN